MLLELKHLVIRDPLAWHPCGLDRLEDLHSSPTRTCPARASTGQDSCRQLTSAIVASQ